MILSIDKNAIAIYLNKQLCHFFPDDICVKKDLRSVLPKTLKRLERCFSEVKSKYFHTNEQPYFNHLNSDHYSMFLYVVANEAYRNNFIVLAEKAFLLNKALHGLDAFYAISLPDIFLFVHPVGTVLGNAHYSNYLVVYQNVTIGSELDGIYPNFGEGCVLFSKSTAIGNCNIGNNVALGSNSFIRNINIDKNKTVIGMTPSYKLLDNRLNNKEVFFRC